MARWSFNHHRTHGRAGCSPGNSRHSTAAGCIRPWRHGASSAARQAAAVVHFGDLRPGAGLGVAPAPVDDPDPLNVLITGLVGRQGLTVAQRGAFDPGDDEIPELLCLAIEGADVPARTVVDQRAAPRIYVSGTRGAQRFGRYGRGCGTGSPARVGIYRSASRTCPRAARFPCPRGYLDRGWTWQPAARLAEARKARPTSARRARPSGLKSAAATQWRRWWKSHPGRRNATRTAGAHLWRFAAVPVRAAPDHGGRRHAGALSAALIVRARRPSR